MVLDSVYCSGLNVFIVEILPPWFFFSFFLLASFPSLNVENHRILRIERG